MRMPGVYADVSEAMCFIDWSTKCVHGQDKDFYEMKGCRNWAKDQYCYAKEAKANAQTPVEKAKLTNLESLYEQAVLGCAYGPDDTDLGNFARDSNFPATTEEPTELGTNPRFGGSEEDSSSGGINFGKR